MLNRDRGFGFIRRPIGQDLFFHISEFVDGKPAFEAMNEGTPVLFEVGDGKRGPEGRNVTIDKV